MWQHRQIAGTSSQVFRTALIPKGLISGTPGKLGGYGKNRNNRENPQPSPKVSRKTNNGCSSQTQCRWALNRA